MVDIAILLDGDDITADVEFDKTTFQSLADGGVGRAVVYVRDTGHGFAPSYMQAGKTLELFIAGEREWDGWVFPVQRGWPFPVDDTSDPDLTPRFWVLGGLDRNLLLQKRFLYRSGDPTDATGIPDYPEDSTDKAALEDIMDTFLDVSGDGLDLSSGIEEVATPGPFEDFTLGYIGAPWGTIFDDASKITGAVFWVGPDRVVRYVGDTVETAPHPLSDIVEEDAVRYREFEAALDATEMANDALVWGAGVSSPNPVFGRHQDSTSISTYGRWQWGDIYIGGGLDETVERRAQTYVEGSPSHRRGHGDPVPVVKCVIHEPGFRVGHVVDFRAHLYDYQENLPIRSLAMSFPTPDAVRYELEMTLRMDTPYGVPDLWGPPGPDGPHNPRPEQAEKHGFVIDYFNRIIGPFEYEEPGPNDYPSVGDVKYTDLPDVTTEHTVDLPDGLDVDSHWVVLYFWMKGGSDTGLAAVGWTQKSVGGSSTSSGYRQHVWVKRITPSHGYGASGNTLTWTSGDSMSIHLLAIRIDNASSLSPKAANDAQDVGGSYPFADSKEIDTGSWGSDKKLALSLVIISVPCQPIDFPPTGYITEAEETTSMGDVIAFASTETTDQVVDPDAWDHTASVAGSPGTDYWRADTLVFRALFASPPPWDDDWGPIEDGPWWDVEHWTHIAHSGDVNESAGIDGRRIWVQAIDGSGYVSLVLNPDTGLPNPMEALENASNPYSLTGRFRCNRTVGSLGGDEEHQSTDKWIYIDTGFDQVYIRFSESTDGPSLYLYTGSTSETDMFALDPFEGGEYYLFRLTKTDDFWGFRVWKQSDGELYDPWTNDPAEWMCYIAGPIIWDTGASGITLWLELSAGVDPGNGWGLYRVGLDQLNIERWPVDSPSDILIELDGVDITRKVVYPQTRFSQSANPMQGTFQVTCRDLERDLDPPIGKLLTLHIDGKAMGGGYLLRVGRSDWFDAGDGTDPNTTRSRKWILTGPDFNVVFDKRILHDPGDHFDALVVPLAQRTLSESVIYLFDNFIDTIPGLDYTTHVDDITDLEYAPHNGLFLAQGSQLRAQMDDFVKWGAIIYYIDADNKLHFHEYENITHDWGFSDAPDGVTTIGFREGMYEEDFSQIVTEALVWGGSSLAFPGPSGDVVFSKYPKAPAADKTVAGRVQTEAREQDAIDRRDLYGRWQYAEMNIGQDNYLTQASVDQRSFVIINGPSGTVPTYGIEGGFNKPTQRMAAAWHAHQVPGADHARAGEVIDFALYSQGDGIDPLVASLPLRSLNISFPTIPGTTLRPSRLPTCASTGSSGPRTATVVTSGSTSAGSVAGRCGPSKAERDRYSCVMTDDPDETKTKDVPRNFDALGVAAIVSIVIVGLVAAVDLLDGDLTPGVLALLTGVGALVPALILRRNGR